MLLDPVLQLQQLDLQQPLVRGRTRRAPSARRTGSPPARCRPACRPGGAAPGRRRRRRRPGSGDEVQQRGVGHVGETYPPTNRQPPPWPGDLPPASTSAPQVRGAVEVEDGAGGQLGLGRGQVETAAATSSGRATRLNGLCARIGRRPRRRRASLAMSVSTNPGATAVTVMPCGASARARDWLKVQAGLARPVGGLPVSPRNAPREETLTIRPPPPQMAGRRTSRRWPARSGWRRAFAARRPAIPRRRLRIGCCGRRTPGVVDHHVEAAERRRPRPPSAGPRPGRRGRPGR